jgi:hypothetical protein
MIAVLPFCGISKVARGCDNGKKSNKNTFASTCIIEKEESKNRELNVRKGLWK